jgi:hypothetical protein
MDPDGKEATELAQEWAATGMVLYALWGFAWGLLLYQVMGP